MMHLLVQIAATGVMSALIGMLFMLVYPRGPVPPTWVCVLMLLPIVGGFLAVTIAGTTAFMILIWSAP
jgi:hypothetical protein